MPRSPAPVSVVIPTHNRAELARRAAESVLEQDPPPAEVIVVDDCSTDHTAQELAVLGDRVRMIRTEVNVERGAARNLGAGQASTDVLAFLDSDDEWMPGKLAAQLPLALAGRASVTALSYIDAEGREIGSTYRPRRGAHRRIKVGNEFLGAPSSLVLPKAIFQRAGGFPEERALQGSEDWIFLLRLILAGDPLDIVPAPLVHYRLHSANDTADPATRERSLWAAAGYVEEHGLLAGRERRRLRARYAETIGRGHAAAGNTARAREWAGIAARIGAPMAAARAVGLITASAARARLRDAPE